MSRYVQVPLREIFRDELLAALAALDLPFQAAPQGERLMLEGSLECAGEPVEIRLPAGAEGTVEDFGFTTGASRNTRPEGGRLQLVCGEYDRRGLERDLLPRLRQTVALLDARAIADRHDLHVEEEIEPDGTRRLLLRHR